MSLFRPTGVLLLALFLLFTFCVCLSYTVLSVPFSLVVSYWEMADLLAILCVMFPYHSGTFPHGFSGKMWYLIASIPDLALFFSFKSFVLRPT